MYDARLGRRWNVDPITVESESPYATNHNDPVLNTDPMGLSPHNGGGEKGIGNNGDIISADELMSDLAQIEIDQAILATQIDLFNDKQELYDFALVDLAKSQLKMTVLSYTPANAAFDDDVVGRTFKFYQRLVDDLEEELQELGEKIEKKIDEYTKHVEEADEKLNRISGIMVSNDAKGNVGIIHKNSNNYKGKQSVYEIRINKKTYKFGKADMTNVNSKGQPTRLNNQLKKLRGEFGEKNVVGNVIKQFKNATTKTVKAFETRQILQWKQKHGGGKYIPSGNPAHKKHGTPQSKPKPKTRKPKTRSKL